MPAFARSRPDKCRETAFTSQAACKAFSRASETYEWSDWRNATFWWIQSVYVTPECRRQGVYRAMHDAIRREARATPGVCGIRLYVEGTNRTAQQAYRRAGMQMSSYRVYEEDFVLPPNKRKESI